MRLAIAIVKDHPTIKAITDELTQRRKSKDDRLEWLKKQAEKILEESVAESKTLWDQLEELLKSSNLLPQGYDPKNWSLHFDHEAGLLFSMDAEERRKGALPDFLKKLLT